jgi:hypothetical protein
VGVWGSVALVGLRGGPWIRDLKVCESVAPKAYGERLGVQCQLLF